MSVGALPAAAVRALSHRITEVPVRGADDGVSGRHRLLGSLAVAHGAGRPVVVAWLRKQGGGAVQVLVGGAEAEPGSEQVQVAFPPGARGRSQGAAEMGAALSSLVWEQSQLALDATNVVTEPPGDRLEDLFIHQARPWGFLVVAHPLSSAEVDATMDDLSDQVGALEALRSGRGVHRTKLARAEQNLDYHDRSAGTGCWRLELWTGGADAAEARVAAAMLAGGGDVAATELVVRPSRASASGNLAWSTSCVVGSGIVAGLARPPFRELPGVRVTPLPDFDQNVEDTPHVRLGRVLDGSRQPAAPYGVSLESINRHVFVTGATGAGKSETVRSLLVSLSRRGLPWMVIEPAKAEYAAVAPWLDPQNGLVVIRPGDPDSPPPMVNPLEPSSILVGGVRHTFPLQTHLDLVRALFTASFDAVEPFPQVLSAGLTRAYQARGWNLVTGAASDPTLTPPRWPVLGDLVAESLAVVDGLGYATDVRDNVRGFIRVRVESLRSGTPGRFFESGYPLDLEDLVRRPVVFEIEDLGDDRDKAFFIGSLVIRVVELIRLRQRFAAPSPGLSHVLVIEEAHRLLRRVAEDSPSAHAVSMFADLLAEVRSYGEGVVVAEQIPSKIITDVVKNSAVKILHRLPAQDDRDTVGSTMNLTAAQSAHVVALEPGTAVAHGAGMDRPVLVRIDRVTDRPPTGATRAEPRLGARSSACPTNCASRRCTLGEIETSRDLVTPEVALWGEQVVIAHLTGDSIGTPSGAWFNRLRSEESRRSRCALSQVAIDSTGRRGSVIRAWYDPEAFGAAIADVLATQLETGRGLARPRGWAVGQFRFRRIRSALSDVSDAADRTLPHPQTARWAAAGVHLPGPSWGEQLAQVKVLATAGRQVHARDLAGSPAVLDALARATGARGASTPVRIASAMNRLGLDYRWMAVRLGDEG